MSSFEYIQQLLNSQHSTGAWLIFAFFALLLGFLSSYIKHLWQVISRRRRGGYDAFLAHHQKLHEGERW